VDALTFLQKHVPLFAGLTPPALQELAVASTLETFKNGQTVLFKGATVDGLHVIATGQVVVQGKGGAAALATLGPGEVFGEASIVDASVAGATVKAGEGGAMVLVIPQEAFRHLISNDQAFAERVRALIASRRAPGAK